MRFRCLNDDELVELDKELVQFLILNHVYKEDWATMNQREPLKAKQLVEMFSDVVLEKVYSKVSYLERQVAKQICFCSLAESSAEMLTVEALVDDIDLTNEDKLDEYLLLTPSKLSIYHGKKNFTKAKADEVFLLLNHRFVMSNEDRYQNLSQHLIKTN